MKYSIVLFMVPALSACVQLTPAGARVQIITEDQSAQVASCKFLGTISVSSEDALRNASAALSGDTAIISHHDVISTSIVRGRVYRCAATDINTGTAISKSVLPIEEKVEAESIRKSRICQTKGGTWAAGQCVIVIE